MTTEVERRGGELLLTLLDVTKQELEKTDEQGRRSSAWGAVARALCKDLNIQVEKDHPKAKALADDLPTFADDTAFPATQQAH